MLKNFRMHLTLICSSITGMILFIICILSLQISENQLNERNHIAFEGQLQTIAYQLQTHQTIRSSWLAQLEVDNQFIISILDNGKPLFFKGSWTPDTDRALLIEKAHLIAQEKYQFDITSPPHSNLSLSKIFFKLQGHKGEYYRVGLVRIPSARGFYSLTLLQDMSSEKASIIHTRILFISISLMGIILLAVFSFWFAGRAILPIEKNQKKQVQFIAAASHELKSPLAVIQSSNSCIQNQEGDIQLFTSHIEKECKRLSRLIDDLLLLATADANTWSIHKAPTELDIVLIDMLDTFIPLANQKNQQFTLTLPEDPLPPILCDSERIAQTIAILLDNALYYVPVQGTIELNVQATTESIVLQVIDNGPGISPEHATHIFDRFYRVDYARKDKNHYGLGLSIAKEIILLHQGSLSLKETTGGGCTFIIKLPLV